MSDIIKTEVDPDNILQKAFRKWMKKQGHLFTIDKLGNAITRNEDRMSIRNLKPMIEHPHHYIDLLFVVCSYTR